MACHGCSIAPPGQCEQPLTRPLDPVPCINTHTNTTQRAHLGRRRRHRLPRIDCFDGVAPGQRQPTQHQLVGVGWVVDLLGAAAGSSRGERCERWL